MCLAIGRFAKAKFMLDSYDAALNLVQEGQSIEPFNAALATLAQQVSFVVYN